METCKVLNFNKEWQGCSF